MRARPDGPCPARFLVVGERPGFDEWRAVEHGDARQNFIGPAGLELWDRLRRVAQIDRDECRTINLVPTFSQDPPTDAEIAHYKHLLTREIRRTRPEFIITVGYHAARWFLPQYRDVNGDYFHGLPHATIRCPGAVVFPLVHSSAALRQPGRYQQQLTDDVQTIATWLRGDGAIHAPVPLPIYQSGLAGIATRRGVIGFDTEFDSVSGEVQALTFSYAHRIGNFYEAYLARDVTHVRDLVTHAPLVAHMAKAEYHSLLALGVERWDAPIDDTMIMAFVLGRPHLGLKALLRRQLQLEQPSYEDIVHPVDDAKMRAALVALHAELEPLCAAPVRKRYLKKSASLPLPETTKQARRAVKSISNLIHNTIADKTLRERWNASVISDRHVMPPEATWKEAPQAIREPYAMGDAVGGRLLRDHEWPLVVARGLRRGYQLQRDVLPFLVRNEHVGLAVDGDELRQLSQAFAMEFALTCAHINELAGHTVNPLSSPQVSDTLFHELGVKATRLTKGGTYTTADKYLKARKREHEIIPLILSARQLNKYKSTYTDKLPSMLIDGRYHPDWLYCGTASSRLAEKIILLIPKHDPNADKEGRANRAKLIRDCFHATDGHTLVSVDLSQIELRVMAHVSGDTKLLRVFERGDDMHADTAHRLLGAPKGKDNQDESAHRLPAKTMNFGIINGMTEYGMLDQLHEAGQLQWDLDQVRAFRTDWFKVYDGVDAYWKRKINEGRKLGYITTMFGRRRYLAGLRSTSEQVRVETERQALGEIQASADDISKYWNIRIWKRVLRPAHAAGWYCEPWIRVHDDTTLEVDTPRAYDVAQHMLALVPDLLSIPTLADAKAGVRWGSIGKLTKPK